MPRGRTPGVGPGCDDGAVHVLALRVELRLPEARSLKDKRQVVRSLLDRARHRFGVSVAEVDSADDPRAAVLGFAVVASSAHHAEEVMDSVERLVWSRPEVEVVSCERRWLDTA